jgi:Xaa-Pro aminopeptidase
MAGNERVSTCISRKELERRWAAVRREMEARNIDALVMQNASDWLGGYVKWFTDVPAHNHYPRTVIFHRADLMTVIEMGAADRRLKVDGQDELNPGVGEFAFTPSFFSISYTHDYDGVLAAEELKRRGYKTIGWVGKGALPFALVNPVEQRLSGASFVDATEFVDVLKAIKSEEEIALIRRAAAMQDAVFAKVVKKIAPGMRDSDLSAYAQYEGELMESQQGVFRGSSAPLGKPAILRGRHFQGRVMGRGD